VLLSASCRSFNALDPKPRSFFSSAAGAFANWDSVVYPADVNVQVGGVQIFLGRPMSGEDMRWMLLRRL